MSCTTACHSPTPSQAHCGVCHRTYGSVTEFDRHRRSAWPTGACPDPASLDLVERSGVWASQERHQKMARLHGARSAAREDAAPAPRVDAQSDQTPGTRSVGTTPATANVPQGRWIAASTRRRAAVARALAGGRTDDPAPVDHPVTPAPTALAEVTLW